MVAGQNGREGITVRELLRRFPDDASAQRWFEERRWGGEPRCTHCDATTIAASAKKTMPYRCRACGKHFSVKMGTLMEGSNLGYQTWALAIYLLTTSLKGVSSKKLHRDLGITQKSAWHLAHRIREAMEQPSDPLTGPVEIDEMHVGGRERNKHAHQHTPGGAPKTIVAGVKDRPTGRVRAAVVPDVRGFTLRQFVRDQVDRGAMVYSDDAAAYHPLPQHRAVGHSLGEYVVGDAHTNGIESFWSMFRRGYYGTYHWMSPKHLNRYVGEFTGRHNMRSADTADQMAAIVRGMVGKRLRYRDLVA